MAGGPHPEILQHPRFEEVFARALAKQGLPHQMGEIVKRLVSGQSDPRSFQCCNTGCMPCVKDYLRAAEQILRELPRDQPPKRRWRWPFTRRD